jgi:hypothetical protein
MKTQTPQTFYRLGSALRFILDAKIGWKIKGDTQVYANVLSIIKNVEDLQLPVTLCAIQPFRKLADTLSKATPTDILGKEQCAQLNSAARARREVVNAELKSPPRRSRNQDLVMRFAAGKSAAGLLS